MTQSINELKSYTEYNVSTPMSVFTIGFQYEYNVDHVNVYVDGVEATAAGYTIQHDSHGTVQLTPAVPSGVVRLSRETDIDSSAHTFSAGAKFTAGNMDENFQQIRHSQQEVRDGLSKLYEDTYAIIDTLEDVGQAAQDAADAAEQAAITANDAAAQVNDKVSQSQLDYIHENGASLPYEAGIAYEENAVVVKDGVLQQWKGGVWVDVVSDHTANSMQDLMQLNPSQTGSLVFVKSYHQGKGLGGGKYQYISILLKSAHDGGTIIDPALAFPTDWDDQAQLEAWFYPTSQTGYGCWSRIGDGGDNIQVFGALPDGVNRVNLILEKMSDIGISIYAPKGIYRVEDFTRQLRGSNDLNQKSMRIYGDLTYGSTDQHYSWAESTVFQGAGDMFKSVVNVRLDNLLFRNTPNATLGKIFTLGAFAQCEWSNCIFGSSNYHIYNHGWSFDGYNVKPSYRNCRFYGAKIYSRYFEGTVANYREENCYTSTNKRGLYLAAPVTASIESCVYEYNEDGAIELDCFGYTGEYGFSLKDVFFETNGAGVPYSGVKSKPHIVIRSTKEGGTEPRADASVINFKQENCYYTDTSSGAKAESCILVDSKTVNIVDVNCWIERAIVSQTDMYSGSLTAKVNFETQYVDTKSTLIKIGKELSAKIIRQGENSAVDTSLKIANVVGTYCDLSVPTTTLGAGGTYDFIFGNVNSTVNATLYVTLGNVSAQYRVVGNTQGATVTEIFKVGSSAGVEDLTVAQVGYPKLGLRVTNTGTKTRFLDIGLSGLIF